MMYLTSFAEIVEILQFGRQPNMKLHYHITIQFCKYIVMECE